jgi:hypothetical protein
MTTSAALDRLLDPVASLLSLDVAQRLSQFRADDQTQARLDELAERANEGLLTPDEQAEYEAYVTAIDLVSILQLKARRRLQSQTAN